MKLPPRLADPAWDDLGQVTAFVVGVFLALWLFAGIVVDGGLALAAKVKAIDNAQEAARTGAQSLDLAALREDGTARLDPVEAEAAAHAYLTATGAVGRVEVTDDTVTVHLTRHQDTQILQLVGLRRLTVTGSAAARAERGTTTQARSAQ
ncbi:pilus assembly protein TadG-related protein [Streptomyces sp. NBC_01803]|uniref:pilus assembly protein TadG-related protein n=1 Tax=Streptomyces sp. NBC_01803 TaxID=2975946 RepID=UPI002DDB1245|nr:hypothetical protein [Streptomyces sp. NBC_01803]WSA44205.1 hypothetical protein OIE51_08285 [Streptomyces sp. NBC_01803]